MDFLMAEGDPKAADEARDGWAKGVGIGEAEALDLIDVSGVVGRSPRHRCYDA